MLTFAAVPASILTLLIVCGFIYAFIANGTRILRKPQVETADLEALPWIDSKALFLLSNELESMQFRRVGDFAVRVTVGVEERVRYFLDPSGKIRVGLAFTKTVGGCISVVAFASLLPNGGVVQTRNDGPRGGRTLEPDRIRTFPRCGVKSLYEHHLANVAGETMLEWPQDLAPFTARKLADNLARLANRGDIRPDSSTDYYVFSPMQRASISGKMLLSTFGLGPMRWVRRKMPRQWAIYIEVAFLFLMAAVFLCFSSLTTILGERARNILLGVGLIGFLIMQFVIPRPHPGEKGFARSIVGSVIIGLLLVLTVFATVLPGFIVRIGPVGGPAASTPFRPMTPSVALSEPMEMDLTNLHNALYLYVVFFAVNHDHWLASEASMAETRITVSDLPEGLDADGLLSLFPAMKGILNDSKGLYVRLDKPSADSYQEGFFVDPAGRRIVMISGAQYTQDGYGTTAPLLGGSASADLLIEMRFLPGDYGDPGDLDRYGIVLSGRLEGGRLIIKKVGGRLSSPEQVRALLAAAADYRTFGVQAEAHSYQLRSEEEAKTVERLFKKEFGAGEYVVRNGREFTVKERAYDLELYTMYVRYGSAVLD